MVQLYGLAIFWLILKDKHGNIGRLQFWLDDLKNEHVAAALSDVQKSIFDVAETQTRRPAERPVVGGVKRQFLGVVQIHSEHLDAVVAAVGNPDAARGVNTQSSRLVKMVDVSARYRAVTNTATQQHTNSKVIRATDCIFSYYQPTRH